MLPNPRGVPPRDISGRSQLWDRVLTAWTRWTSPRPTAAREETRTPHKPLSEEMHRSHDGLFCVFTNVKCKTVTGKLISLPNRCEVKKKGNSFEGEMWEYSLEDSEPLKNRKGVCAVWSCWSPTSTLQLARVEHLDQQVSLALIA